MLDFSTLSQAIAQGVQFNNKFFKRRQAERHWEPTPPTQWSFALIMPPKPLAIFPKEDPMIRHNSNP